MWVNKDTKEYYAFIWAERVQLYYSSVCGDKVKKPWEELTEQEKTEFMDYHKKRMGDARIDNKIHNENKIYEYPLTEAECFPAKGNGWGPDIINGARSRYEIYIKNFVSPWKDRERFNWDKLPEETKDHWVLMDLLSEVPPEGFAKKGF